MSCLRVHVVHSARTIAGQLVAALLLFVSGALLLLASPALASFNASATLYGIGWAVLAFGIVLLFRRDSPLWMSVRPLSRV